MSYKEKLKIERTIEVFNKISICLYALVVAEIAAYVLGIKIAFIDLRAISIEKYALGVVCTAILGIAFGKISKKIKEDFIRRLKYRE